MDVPRDPGTTPASEQGLLSSDHFDGFLLGLFVGLMLACALLIIGIANV